MNFEQIIYEVDDRVAVITLNRPEMLNAWTLVMMENILQALDMADNDDNVRVVIFTGAGRNPPSVPTWIQEGPIVAGSGTPPTLPSEGQRAGNPLVLMAGTILTSVFILPSDVTTDGSATYICRLNQRSSAAFSILKR